MTDTLSLRARRALAALGVKNPRDLATVSLSALRSLPNCGPHTICEIASWGGEHAAHLQSELIREEWERVARLEAPHVPPPRLRDSERRAAEVVKVCPPSVEERERWKALAKSRGVSLSRLASDLLSRECDEQSKGGV